MEQAKEPHSISLKVLRLARPSLAEQFPLPELPDGDLKSLDPRAALSYPDAADKTFILSPLLALPSGFGTAYVGSTFSCTICANNELPEGDQRSVSSVRLGAEIQTPSHSSDLKLLPEGTENDPAKVGLPQGGTLQKLLRFDLREEGQHTLAVSVTYETTNSANGAVMGRRTRSFRKLYTFAALPCLSVRTKATDLLSPSTLESRDARQALEKTGERFALEAQLENLTSELITLESVSFDARAPFASTSLNWDMPVPEGEEQHLHAPTLSPRAVSQVCYIIAESDKIAQETGAKKEITKDGRFVLGTLSIRWRGPMGDPGVLSTGWLTSRRR